MSVRRRKEKCVSKKKEGEVCQLEEGRSRVSVRRRKEQSFSKKKEGAKCQ